MYQIPGKIQFDKSINTLLRTSQTDQDPIDLPDVVLHRLQLKIFLNSINLNKTLSLSVNSQKLILNSINIMKKTLLLKQ